MLPLNKAGTSFLHSILIPQQQPSDLLDALFKLSSQMGKGKGIKGQSAAQTSDQSTAFLQLKQQRERKGRTMWSHPKWRARLLRLRKMQVQSFSPIYSESNKIIHAVQEYYTNLYKEGQYNSQEIQEFLQKAQLTQQSFLDKPFTP